MYCRRTRQAPACYAVLFLTLVPATEVTFVFKPGSETHADRVRSTVDAALGRFEEWFGAHPDQPLTLSVTTHWLSPERDGSLERFIIASIARQYWSAVLGNRRVDESFRQGLTLYSGARAINDVLEGRHWLTERYFGGFIPYTIRSVPLSRRPTDPRPIVRAFAELDQLNAAPEAQRLALALHSLERYIGWPALQQALETFVHRVVSDQATAADFAAMLSDQCGQDLRWFFDETYGVSARFDYGIESFASDRVSGNPPKFETTLRLRRYGASVFASRALPVAIAFEDGTEVNEWWDGREDQVQLQYITSSRGARASVDAHEMLLLDEDRSNNIRTLEPRLPAAGTRTVLNWLVWLQDLMLTYTSLV